MDRQRLFELPNRQAFGDLNHRWASAASEALASRRRSGSFSSATCDSRVMENDPLASRLNLSANQFWNGLLVWQRGDRRALVEFAVQKLLLLLQVGQIDAGRPLASPAARGASR
jgi:hypothetical protein